MDTSIDSRGSIEMDQIEHNDKRDSINDTIEDGRGVTRFLRLPYNRQKRSSTTRQRFASKHAYAKSMLRTEFFLSDEQSSQLKISHDAKFRWKQFGLSFLMHFFYFFVVGPMAYMFMIEQKIYNMFYNFGFVGLTLKHLQQVIQYISIMFFVIIILLNKDAEQRKLFLEQLIFLMLMMLIRIIVISSKYATLLPWRFSEYYERKLSPESFSKDLSISWALQKDEIVIRELVLSMNRSNYDKSMFQFEFFFDMSEKEDEKLQIQIETVARYHNGNSLTKVNGGLMFPPELDYLLFGDRNIYHGYTIFYQLVQQARIVDERTRRYYFAIAIFVNAWRIFLGWIIKQVAYPSKFNFYGSSTAEGLAIFGLEISTFLVGTQNMLQLLNVVTDLNRTIFLCVQASYLVSIQKSSIGYNSDFAKYFPSINFIDTMTISSWGMLRHLIYDYGTPYRYRYQTQLACYFLTNLVQLLLIFMAAIDKSFNFFSIYTRVMSFYEITQTLFILIICFHKISIINEHFEIHKRLIIENKLLLQNLKQQRKYYFDDQRRFFSNNIPYTKIVERLKLNYTDLNSIVDQLDSLIDAYDMVLEKIDVDTDHCPYKLLGIKITKDFLLQVALTITSIIPVAIIASLQSGRFTLG